MFDFRVKIIVTTIHEATIGAHDEDYLSDAVVDYLDEIGYDTNKVDFEYDIEDKFYGDE